MKRIIILIVLMMLSFTLFGTTVLNNEDKPLKGKWDFNLKKVWQVDAAGNDMLVQLGSIVIDDAGNVFIMERKHGKIFTFNSEGKYLNSIGKQGEGPGEYKSAFKFHLNNNLIIVPDMGRFHYFKKNGEYIKSINSGVSFIFPKVFIDDHRFIYEKEIDQKKIKRDVLSIFDLIDKKSTKITEIVSSKPSTASSGGMQLVVKTDTTSVVYDKESMYIGKGDKYLIKKIDLKGNVLLSFGIKDRKKIKVTEEMKRKKYSRIVLNGGKMPKAMVDQLIKNDPDVSPYFNNIKLINGLLFVRLIDPSNINYKVDIFSGKGKYLYQGELVLPDALELKSGPVFKGGFAYVFAENEDGEATLLKFKAYLPKN